MQGGKDIDAQPCISCGRDTRPGTRLFSARKGGIDLVSRERGFLCQACQKGSAVVGPDQELPAGGRFAVVEFQGFGIG